jgi:hypothetical protein
MRIRRRTRKAAGAPRSPKRRRWPGHDEAADDEEDVDPRRPRLGPETPVVGQEEIGRVQGEDGGGGHEPQQLHV